MKPSGFRERGDGITSSLYERRLDDGEFLDVAAMSADELDAAALRGDLTDAKTLIGLLWLQNWRAGRWPLAWRPAPADDAGGP